MDAAELAQVIGEAFERGRVEVTRHFWDELRADAFILADLRCALESITRVADMGLDRAGNPKLEATGSAADGRELSVICSLKPTGAVLLITIYEASGA